jgi:hypothetical protein
MQHDDDKLKSCNVLAPGLYSGVQGIREGNSFPGIVIESSYISVSGYSHETKTKYKIINGRTNRM